VVKTAHESYRSRQARTPKSSRPQLGWRLGRGSAIAAILAASLVGASIGASTHPAPTSPFKASATVLMMADSKSLFALKSFVESEIQLPEPSSPGGVLDDIQWHAPAGSMGTQATLRISARARSPADVVKLANDFASQFAAAGRQLVLQIRRDPNVVGDFEDGTELWGTTTPLFSVAPAAMTISGSNAKFNGKSLRVDCLPRRGCGPWLEVTGLFQPSATYRVSGWALGDEGEAVVALTFGSTSRDVASSDPVPLTTGWRRLSVRWTPTRPTATAQIALQRVDDAGGRFYIDRVILGAADTSARIRSVAGTRRHASIATVLPATRATRAETSTLVWTLGGAGVGAAMALGGIGAAFAARRRRRTYNGGHLNESREPTDGNRRHCS
jgi:Carbohydrate binding domain